MIRKVRSSEWVEDSTGSTLAARDYKDTGDVVVQPAWWDGGDTADSLTTTSDAQRMPDKQRLQAVVDTPKMLFVRGGVEVDRHGKKAGKGALLTDDESATLDAGNHWTLFQPQAFRKSRRPQTDEDAETWIDDGDANTLNTFDSGETRTTHAVVEAKSFDEMNFTASDTHHVLRSGTKQSTGALTEYGVRRLTPVECERLQSFPDGWTEPSGSDSARYKAMGNAVTVNTVRWILGRMLEQS